MKLKDLQDMTREIENKILKIIEKELNIEIFKEEELLILEEFIPPSKYDFFIERTIRNLKEKVAHTISQKIEIKKEQIDFKTFKFTAEAYLLGKEQIKLRNAIADVASDIIIDITKWLLQGNRGKDGRTEQNPTCRTNESLVL